MSSPVNLKNPSPVRIGTLRAGVPITFDLFVQVGQRHLHYLRKKDEIDPERIKSLKSKGVKKLFIPEEEEPLYLAYLEAGLNQLGKDSKLKLEDKGALAKDSLSTESENAIKNVSTEQGYRSTEGRIQKVIDFLLNDAGAVQSVLKASGVASDTFMHSANVATISLGLATRLGITAAQDHMELGLAAILHDMSKSQLGFAGSDRYSQLPPDRQKEFEKHPAHAATFLASKPYVTKGVLQLITDHEEIGEAAGYPNKKRISQLPLSSQVLNLCNHYDGYCQEKGLAPLDAMATFFSDKLGLFDLGHIKQLKEVLSKKKS